MKPSSQSNQSIGPDSKGHFGRYGGRFVPETLMQALYELEAAFKRWRADHRFQSQFKEILQEYAGRPTPLYEARRLSRRLKTLHVWLKREDLLHTGAHKINNTLGQILLAKAMGKKRIIAETGAGQHGVATATAAALMGLPCVIYMGAEDVRRQALNVVRMKILGAVVKEVASGSATLKDAMNEAIRDWVTNVRDTYYLIGSVAGPHPYPWIVREFQSVIGAEARRQFQKAARRLPDVLLACVGGGSNAMGLFHPFFKDKSVAMIGVEAAGEGLRSGHHAAPLAAGQDGILHGSLSKVLQTHDGQIKVAHSIAAGLDYPGVGPEHAFYRDLGRATYVTVTDRQAIEGVRLLAETEGIIPALETAHAIGYLPQLARQNQSRNPKHVIVCLSGRGDKDMGTLKEWMDGQD